MIRTRVSSTLVKIGTLSLENNKHNVQKLNELKRESNSQPQRSKRPMHLYASILYFEAHFPVFASAARSSQPRSPVGSVRPTAAKWKSPQTHPVNKAIMSASRIPRAGVSARGITIYKNFYDRST